jgi:hypothetical protein
MYALIGINISRNQYRIIMDGINDVNFLRGLVANYPVPSDQVIYLGRDDVQFRTPDGQTHQVSICSQEYAERKCVK